jgi:hypothetical protein
MAQVHLRQLKRGYGLLYPSLGLLYLRLSLGQPSVGGRWFADLRLLQLGFRLFIACLVVKFRDPVGL